MRNEFWLAAAFGALVFLLSRAASASPGGSLIPASDATKQAFIDAMTPAAEASAFLADGRDLLIAWAAWESDWGRGTAFRKGNNPFNVTAGRSWTGPTVPGPDTEVSDAGTRAITQDWRVYADLFDGVSDTLNLIDQSRFGGARSLLLSGDESFVPALYAGRYFTLPPEKYAAGVSAALADVQRLTGGAA